MAVASSKRSLPPDQIAHNAVKRRKVASKTIIATQKKAKIAQKADTLPWKSISAPEHLDDYEGFFGLEEVDDVDIVRDDTTGRISYIATSTDQTTKPQGVSKADVEENFDEDGEEWSGFDERDNSPAAKAVADSTAKTRQKPPKATTKKRSSSPNKVNASHAISAFASLPTDMENGSDVDVSAWRTLHLLPDTLASLARLKFPRPTPIQSAAIPEILAGNDVIGKASTGSGKTLAFGIPILERFLEQRADTESKASSKQREKTPLALILSPTRELAHQLDKHITSLCSNGLFEGPSIATLTGGLSVQKQQRLLKDADIVIGTPGRLWEVISAGQGSMAALKQIQFLVIDEADRLLSEGHFKEVEEILNALERVDDNDQDEGDIQKATSKFGEATDEKKVRQTLVFSATFDRSLQSKLAGKSKPSGNNLLTNKESLEYLLSKITFHSSSKPKFIDVNPINQLATGLKEGLTECAGTEKDLYLYTLLLLHPNTRTLIFTNSISAVRRITPFLQNLNLPALSLHSGMPQKARLRSVERFTQSTNTSAILVATDVAARGLDIPNVQLIIHYHLPRAADTYVHRSGRTARAGQPGSSVLICAPEEVAGVRRLVAKVHAQSAISSDNNPSDDAAKQGYYIRTLDLDRRIVSRLKPRATLAKKLADATIAKEKQHKEDDFMRAAAEELGVDYDSEEMEKADRGRRGRGSGRKLKEKQAREMSKGEVGAVKAELKQLLQQRVNVGVSERYLTSGGVDVDELLRQQEEVSEKGGQVKKTGEFLGSVQNFALADL